MRASREYRKWVNKLRKRAGKRNGVVRSALLDCPEMERKAKSSNRLRKHHEKERE